MDGLIGKMQVERFRPIPALDALDRQPRVVVRTVDNLIDNVSPWVATVPHVVPAGFTRLTKRLLPTVMAMTVIKIRRGLHVGAEYEGKQMRFVRTEVGITY